MPNDPTPAEVEACMGEARVLASITRPVIAAKAIARALATAHAQTAFWKEQLATERAAHARTRAEVNNLLETWNDRE